MSPCCIINLGFSYLLETLYSNVQFNEVGYVIFFAGKLISANAKRLTVLWQRLMTLMLACLNYASGHTPSGKLPLCLVARTLFKVLNLSHSSERPVQFSCLPLGCTPAPEFFLSLVQGSIMWFFWIFPQVEYTNLLYFLCFPTLKQDLH